jgi:hypothetical protein
MQFSVPFIWIVYSFQRDVFLVLEQAIKLGSEAMEPEFRQYESDISFDEGAISPATIMTDCTGAGFQPTCLTLCFFQGLYDDGQE